MAFRDFPASWIAIYRASSNRYHSTNNPVRVGGSYGYNSYIGIPSSVRDAIQSSSTPAKLYVRFRVTDGAEFDVGGHRESSNKGSGTMPWYRYLGLHPILGTGWYSINLTDAFMSEYLRGNYRGIVLYGGSDYGQAYGRTGDSNQLIFRVEGTWNTPPSPPKITSPDASFIADETIPVRWTAGSDNETSTSQLRYQVQRNYDGTWGPTNTTTEGATSFTFNSRNFPETSRARVRVRTYDGELTSNWVYSDYFTISHNKPPARPSNLSPDGGGVRNREETQRFTWKHNDDGAQAGYKLAWRVVGETAWNYLPSSGFYNSTDERHDFGPNTFPMGEIEWRVMTKDQQGLESPWSPYARVTFGERSDAPIILSPSSGGTVSSSDLIVEWSSLDQQAYEIELLDGSTVLWRESQSAGNKAVRAGHPLENNKTYTVRMRVLSSSAGVWSNWTTQSFSTSFVAPLDPTVSIRTLTEFGDSADTIEVSWSNPEPDPAKFEPQVIYAEVFKRQYNSMEAQEWILMDTNLAPDSYWVDYTPANGVTYEYKVRVWGDNDTFTDSSVVEGSVTFGETYLQRARVLSDLIKLTDSDTRELSMELGGAGMMFAGRKLPVWEHNVSQEQTLSVTFRVYEPEELRTVMEFIKRKETFLYRDNVGRKMYCIVRSPAVTDLPVNGFDITIELYEVDYKEGRSN